MKSIKEQHSEELLKEMLSRVGANYETFDFTEPNWFWKHEWTQAEQDDFQTWVSQKLIEWKYVKRRALGKYTPEYEASKIVNNYGWKTK